jgi:hypothetical protein
MRKLNRKALSIALAIVLVLSLSVTAFAAWPSFQNDNTNNGVIATQPPITSPTVTALPLLTNNPSGDVYTGVDTTTVINNGVAYTLYNGGHVDGTDGGARLNATTLSTAEELFNIQLDASADNAQQLSTPYVSGNTLYAATTYYSNLLNGTSTDNWSGLGSGTIPKGTTTITYNDIVSVPADYWEPQLTTDINATGTIDATAQVTLTPTGGGAPYNFPLSTYYPGYGDWIIYNSGNTNILPIGDYTLSVTFDTDTALPVSSLQFLVSNWHLYSVAGVNTDSPSPSQISVSSDIGFGQANTPISYDQTNGKFIYFGIYEGDRSYYQYDTSGGSDPLIQFPINDDFYNAGAASVFIGSDDYIVFGSDSSKIYVQPAGVDFGDPTSGYITTLDPTLSPGGIRSSIVSYSGNSRIYVTSKGLPNEDGLIWSIGWSLLTSNTTATGGVIITESDNSTSTPVISDNGILYVGTSWYDDKFEVTRGSVKALNSASFDELAFIYGSSSSGDAVQSSPIVYSDEDNEIDYIYFTTNADHTYDPSPVTNHNAYCYEVDVSGASPSPSLAWNPSIGGTYALQGFASDSGYLVFGDDANNLTIFH